MKDIQFNTSHRQESLSVSDWFETPFGRYLLAEEKKLLKTQLSDLCGYHLMQIGVGGKNHLALELGHSHQFYVEMAPGSQASMVADSEHLPLPSNIIDTVLLHHALEFSQDPHRVLGEVARVVAPGGHVILLVLNPASCFGLARFLLANWHRQNIWQHHALRYDRLHDWLRLLGLQPVKVFRGCHRMPIQWQGWLDRLALMDKIGAKIPLGGAFYGIVARKQVAPLTPVGRKHRHQLTIPVVEKPVASSQGKASVPTRRN